MHSVRVSMTRSCWITAALRCVACGGRIDAAIDASGSSDAAREGDSDADAAIDCSPYVLVPVPDAQSPWPCGACDDLIARNDVYALCTEPCTTVSQCGKGFVCAPVSAGVPSSANVCTPACDGVTACPPPMQCSAGPGLRPCY